MFIIIIIIITISLLWKNKTREKESK